MGSFPSPSGPPSPSAPLHRSANRAPSTPGIDLGGLDRPSLLPHAPPFFHGRHLRRLPPPRAIQGHHRLLLRPKTFVGSISAHEIAADLLASDGNGAVDTGAPPGSAFRPSFVLSIAHKFRFSPFNSSSGLSFQELPSLHRRDWKRWVHRRFRRHSPRRRRPTEPAPSSRRQLLWSFYPNYFSHRVAVYAADRAHFTATDTAGAFNDQLLWTSTASTAPLPSAKTTPSPVRTRGAATSPFQTNYLVSSDHRPFISALTTSSADTTTPPLPAWNAFPYPLKTTLSFSIGPFLEPLHHPFPQRSWPYQDHRPACTLHAFTVRQLRIREPATPRDRGPSSQGIIAFSPSSSLAPRCRR